MTNVRRLTPLPLPDDLTPAAIGPRPTIVRMNPAELSVDAAYQRDLSRKSISLIHKLIREWDWKRYKPPVVAKVGDAWHVIDGQHTAIAAASHGGLDEIDVMIVEADDGEARAKAFIGHNRDRVQITNTQLFFAAAAAGDEDALTTIQVCARAGATILKNPSPGRPYQPGEVVAVSSLVKLVKARSAMKARVVVETLVKARVAPISADMIRTVDMVLYGEGYEGEILADDVASAIMRLGHTIDKKASEIALAKKMQRWRAAAIVLFQHTRKRRGSSRAA